MKRPLQLSLRLSARELARFKRYAEHKGLPVSVMIRSLVKRAAEAAGVADEGAKPDPRQTSIEGS